MSPSRAALAALLLAGGCASTPRERFPIGLFNVADPAHLARIRDAGFDHVFPAGGPEDEDAVAEEAKRLGMKVVASPAVQRDARSVRDWPVAAWYLSDEPDVNGVAPERLRATAESVRAWDRRPQTFTVGQGSAAEAYGAIGDYFMLDWYPVPHLPLEGVAEQIDEATRRLPAGKPLWFVVQAFDWIDDGRSVGRFPFHEEIRFMSWLAVMHGAKGLFFFRFPRPEGKTLFDAPQHWRSLELVSRELKAFQPVLERGSPLAPPFALKPEGLEARSWRFRGRQYLLVLNRRGDADLKLPSDLLGPGWTLFSDPGRDAKELLRSEHGAFYLPARQVLLMVRRP